MDNKAKLSECLGYLAVALAQYVMEYGLPYGYKVDQVGGEAIRIQLTNYERIMIASNFVTTDYILSLKDPIEYLRMDLIDMHKKLSGEETDETTD